MKPKYYYKIYGMRIHSDFEFIPLRKLSKEERLLEPQITIQEQMLPQEFKEEQECYYHINQDKSVIANSYCYLLIEKGEKIFYERKQQATKELLSAYILGWGIAALVYQRGQLAIHCSCVEKDGKAIFLSGNSGSGKSTITSGLLEKGYSLMADDMSVVKMAEKGDVLAMAAFPYQKLCRDAAETISIPVEEMVYIDEERDKFLVPYQGTFEDRPTPLKVMFVLEIIEGDKVMLQELTGAEKLQACMNALFLAPLLGESLYALENGMRVLKFASKISVYSVKRPIGRNSKEEVLETILKVLQRKHYVSNMGCSNT